MSVEWRMKSWIRRDEGGWKRLYGTRYVKGDRASEEVVLTSEIVEDHGDWVLTKSGTVYYLDER